MKANNQLLLSYLLILLMFLMKRRINYILRLILTTYIDSYRCIQAEQIQPFNIVLVRATVTFAKMLAITTDIAQLGIICKIT